MNPPPDPEGENDKRAERGGFLIDQYQRRTNYDEHKTVLVDLLADMMHWCDRNNVSFDESVDTAEFHYTAETQTVED